MLKMNEVELEVFSDIVIRSLLKKEWGDIAKRHSKANDINEPSKSILYLDANNIYGWAIGQYFPL